MRRGLINTRMLQLLTCIKSRHDECRLSVHTHTHARTHAHTHTHTHIHIHTHTHTHTRHSHVIYSSYLHPHELQSNEPAGLFHKQRISGFLLANSKLISLCYLLYCMVEGLASIQLARMERTEDSENDHLKK